MTRTPVLAVCTLLLLPACRKSDTVPAYLEIPRVGVEATGDQGSTSRITDVWVSVDDKDLGVWELPARIPVVGDGPRTIRIAAGVKRNGTFDDRLQYPFYTAWQNTVDLTATGTSTIDALVRYQGAAIWSERFNEAGTLLHTSSNSDTTLILYTPSEHPSIVLDGTTCGGFVLEPGRTHMELYTDLNFDPVTGPAFLELDYSTDVNLVVGFTYNQGGMQRTEPWVVLVPTTNEGGLRWNKVYIDVSTFFNTASISHRDFYIQANLPSGRSGAHVYLDDFKLVRPI